MVTRKSSLPYPRSPTNPPTVSSTPPAPTAAPPPPPPPLSSFGPQRPDLNVDTSDVPRVPSNAHRPARDSPFADMGNPWTEREISESQAPIIPNSLKPRMGRVPSPPKAPMFDVDIMQPGYSGQVTPKSSSESLRSNESRDFWEDSGDEREDNTQDAHGLKKVDSSSAPAVVLPKSTNLSVQRKPVGSSPSQEQAPFISGNPDTGFASNNPFRQGPTWANAEVRGGSTWSFDDTSMDKDKGKGKGKETAEPPSSGSTLPSFGNLQLGPQSTGLQSSSVNPDKSLSNHLEQETQHIPSAPPTVYASSIPVPHTESTLIDHPGLIPLASESTANDNPWASQDSLSVQRSPLPPKAVPTEDLLDRGKHADGPVDLSDELKALPNHAPEVTLNQSEVPQPALKQQLLVSQPPLISAATYGTDTTYAPPPGPPPSYMKRQQEVSEPVEDLLDPLTSDFLLPVKPPRPAIVTNQPSEQEIAQWQEWRNETYQIKHFNWFDHRSNKLRRSSMLIQNKNGPCPLLALVNALILGSIDAAQQASLDTALQNREQVSLGLIIETLMDELLSGHFHANGGLPEIDNLNRFLMKLRTGMNMNPRFVPSAPPPPNLMDARNSMLHLPTRNEPQDQPGTFEPTEDLKLYTAFRIKTVHGWLPEPESDPARAFARSAQNYEDAQVKQFGEEELEYKFTHSGLTDQEQALWQDIMSIKEFFYRFPTQLTDYGLRCISTSMKGGEFAILFRNDHFSTIYKHPRDGRLYSLITDAGFADRDEIIWESLVDISGQHNEFFSGDFQSVSHAEGAPTSSRQASDRLAPETMNTPLSPQEQQEQADADFAMALQLQEEEEQDQRRRRAQSQSQPQAEPVEPPTPAPVPTLTRTPRNGRRNQGIPIPLPSDRREDRPAMPPRTGRVAIPGVNRPADTEDSDAPPAYEEAAKGQPYNPPLGSPLHPASAPTPDATPSNSTSQVNLTEPPSPGRGSRLAAGRFRDRRNSAYAENHARHGSNGSLQAHANRPQQGTGRFEMGMSPAYEFTDNASSSGRMPGSYIHTGRGGHGQSVGYGSQYSGGRRDDRDCAVM